MKDWTSMAKGRLMTPAEKTLDSYNLTISKISTEDIPELHVLSVSVRWPHRADDWAQLIQLGEGYIARDELGRLISSMMWFPIGDDVASVGMAISSPRLQEQGAGRWLAEHVLQETGDRNLILNATKNSLQLCLDMGFEIVKPLFHINGLVTQAPEACNLCVSEFKDNDKPELIHLDQLAVGFYRPDVVNQLLKYSKCLVLRRNEVIEGYAMCRKFGRGYAIGPVVASNEADAISLIQPFLAKYHNQFLRIDTHLEEGPLLRFLTQAGLNLHETVTSMARGKFHSPSEHVHMMAIASQAYS